MRRFWGIILCLGMMLNFVGCGKSQGEAINLKIMNTVIESKDAYVRYNADNSSFEIGNGKSSLVISASGGGIGTVQYVNKKTGINHIARGKKLGFSFLEGKQEKNSLNLGLNYKDYSVNILSHGEIQLVISLEGSQYDVDYIYTVYPGTSLIKSRYVLTNVLNKTVTVTDPSFIEFQGNSGVKGSEKLVYITGGGNFTGSLKLKENALTDEYQKTMLSYDEREVSTNSKGYFDSTQDVWNGYSGYEPFIAIQNALSGNGVYFLFEYAGLWKADIARVGEENTSLKAGVTLYSVMLDKNESYISPESYMGTFSKNLDDATNDMLSYQYDYMWDYTGEIYPLSSTDTWTMGGSPTYDKVVALAEQARYMGIDLVHIDDNIGGIGWYDKKMDWNSQFDLKSISDYLHASGIKSSVWSPVQHYDYTANNYANNIGLEIPDLDSGFYGPMLCPGNDETIAFMKNKQNEIIKTNSLDMIKMDGWVIAPCEDATHTHGGSENGYGAAYRQYYSYLDYMKSICDSNEKFSWVMCASGGELHGLEYLKYATYVTTTDGAAENAIASLSYMFPSGKFQSGYASVKNYSPANTRTYGFSGGITASCSMDTSVEYSENMELLRKDIALYRYLRDNGVLGRYSWQYHLTTSVLGHSIFMKTDRYADKAVIMEIPAGYDKKIYPVGLDPEKTYTVSFYNNKNYYTATGEELINKGISVAGCELGEMIFFNMLNTPGSGRDLNAPYLPNECVVGEATYIGKKGMALNWSAASDNNFVSYYAIYKNGMLADKVSLGTFWFDKEGTSADVYQIVAVDGDENYSQKVTAKGEKLK